MNWIVAGLIAGVGAFFADFVMWGKVFTGPEMRTFSTMPPTPEERKEDDAAGHDEVGRAGARLRSPAGVRISTPQGRAVGTGRRPAGGDGVRDAPLALYHRVVDHRERSVV